MSFQLNIVLWVIFFVIVALMFALQIFMLLHLKKAKHEIRSMQKQTKNIPYLLRLLGNTQKQLDTLFYEILREGDSLSRQSLQKILKKSAGMRPSRIVPPHLEERYTMQGRIPIREKYRDSAYPNDAPLFYSKEEIDTHCRQIRDKVMRFPRYGMTNIWLFESLKKYPIQGKSVAIMGSNKPWYESVCLQYKGLCTTIEYNPILTDHPDLKFLTPAEYDKNPVQFDAAFSISSFEHDGLGRFGDPLNPEGDLEAMQKMKKMVKPGGLLYLAVPVGKDMVFWNANRVYGKLRFPLLIDGWKVLDSFGYDPQQLESEKNRFEPLFVLENS